MYLELDRNHFELDDDFDWQRPLDSPRLYVWLKLYYIPIISPFSNACTHLNMFDRYNCSKMLQFFSIIIFLIMIDRDVLILLFPKKFVFREIRRASIMHRLTDKKFSLREKIMATFMFVLSAVLVFIIYKTNSISALGVNSYRIGHMTHIPGSIAGTSVFQCHY